MELFPFPLIRVTGLPSSYNILMEEWQASLFEYKENNYIQIKKLIEYRLMKYKAWYINNDMEALVNLKQQFPVEEIKEWCILFDSFEQTDLYTNHFNLIRMINKFKLQDKELLTFYIYRNILDFFCDLVALNQNAKCFFMYICLCRLTLIKKDNPQKI